MRKLLLASVVFPLATVPAWAAHAAKPQHAHGAKPAVGSDFGGGPSPLPRGRRYGVASDPLSTCVALWNSTIVANGVGKITGPVMNTAFNCLPALFNAQGTFVGSVWHPSIPGGTVSAGQVSGLAAVATSASAGDLSAGTLPSARLLASLSGSPQFAMTTSGYTVPSGVVLVRLTQSSTIDGAVVNLTSLAPADGQAFEIDNFGGGNLTTFSFNPAVIGWTNGAAFVSPSVVRLRYAGSTWERVQ